uniref:Uncharacterized protein n=1 Tax=Arundo donax TaxID=35708 RepID=A0A0A9FXT3_ARUDO
MPLRVADPRRVDDTSIHLVAMSRSCHVLLCSQMSREKILACLDTRVPLVTTTW